MLSHIKAIIQYLLPKQLLTRFFGCLAEKKLGIVTTWLIKGFAKCYKVNLQEAEKSTAEAYSTFNEFFARHLEASARPIAAGDDIIVMPADGMISQFGRIKEGQLLQAKGHLYTLDALLACHLELVRAFEDGQYVTTYLSPKDYHRIHMPCQGTLRQMIYVPGSLFSVNIATTENIPNLFARNERVICLFDTALGPVAQILVGATIVGSIETRWQGTVTPPREGIMKSWHYGDDNAVSLAKGDDMGCFKLGSTVITLFAANQVAFIDTVSEGVNVRVGQPLAKRIVASDAK